MQGPSAGLGTAKTQIQENGARVQGRESSFSVSEFGFQIFATAISLAEACLRLLASFGLQRLDIIQDRSGIESL